MTKIVINKCHGGFGLSPKAQCMFLKAKGKECYFYKQTKYNIPGYDDINEYKRLSIKEATKEHFILTITKDFGSTTSDKFPHEVFFSDYDIERDDPDLISIVEKLGEKANDYCSKLEIIEIPDDVEWEIDEYDGWESIHEKHRSWG